VAADFDRLGAVVPGTEISKWKVGACVMSSASLSTAPDGVLAASFSLVAAFAKPDGGFAIMY
jgi:hypothetical protein